VRIALRDPESRGRIRDHLLDELDHLALLRLRDRAAYHHGHAALLDRRDLGQRVDVIARRSNGERRCDQ
jgi:hypothetical protein